MPRYPHVDPDVAAIPGSLFSTLGHKLAAWKGELYPLHIGDTWMEPPAGCRMEDLTVAEYPGLHRYTTVHGLAPLLDAIAERATRLQGVPTAPDDVLVTAGATGALSAIIRTLCSPGDELLVVAPFWPLIRSAALAMGATPVAVPLFETAHDPASAIAALEAARTPRTVAVYYNTPHNPTGRVIPPEWLAAIAVWARKQDLWVLADEVYEHYVYRGEHAYGRSLAPERTFSAHSFSKAYGMTGNRCGYLLGPPAALRAARNISTNTWYCAPRASQVAALRALAGPGDAWAAEAAALYAELGRDAADALGVARPEGSTFLFVDVAHCLDERGLEGFLFDCADEGLFVAPGAAFGPYPTHVRICFTAAEPAVIRRGVERFARRIGR
ncbi:MAG: pyridoxal phosphate-dependent aminotransferase [bacterium]|nr:pyridoxal phosphate-dependent aminotransferase [Myxococcales bacterium]